MDRENLTNPEIRRLVRQAEIARSRLSDDISELRRKLDFPTRIRASLENRPSIWLLGSIGSGLLASLILRRRAAPAPAPTPNRNLKSTAISLLTTAAQPLLKAWLTGRLQQWASGMTKPTDDTPSSINPRSINFR